MGAGWISQEAFLPAAAESENSTVTALVSGNVEKASSLANFHGIDQIVEYQQYDALLAGDTIDAVYIAVPNPLHASYAIRAAAAGKHVLIEKPIATTIYDAEAMIAAARDPTRSLPWNA